MITIKKKADLIGAEKYGQCASCSKGSSDAKLYQITFSYEDSTKSNAIDLCEDCLFGLGDTIYNMYMESII